MGIGSKLQELMIEKDTYANELAAKTGIPAQTIYSLIRRDATKIEIDHLVKISQALSVNVEYFCSDRLQSPQTLVAHFDSDEYTESELNEIKRFAEFIKAGRNFSN